MRMGIMDAGGRIRPQLTSSDAQRLLEFARTA